MLRRRLAGTRPRLPVLVPLVGALTALAACAPVPPGESATGGEAGTDATSSSSSSATSGEASVTDATSADPSAGSSGAATMTTDPTTTSATATDSVGETTTGQPASCGNGQVDPGELCYEGPFAHGNKRARAEDLALGDVDGDGALDVITINGVPLPGAEQEGIDYTIEVFLGDGQGGFSDAVWSGAPKHSSPTAGVVVVDLDLDGHADLVTAGDSADATILRGVGDGTFIDGGDPIPLGLEPSSSPVAIAARDLDGDGAPDLLAIGGAEPGALAVTRGDGGGGTLPPTLYAAGVFPNSLALGQLGGDAHVDAVAGNWWELSLTIFPGAAGGSFADAWERPTVDTPRAVALVDLNEDGADDVVMTLGALGLGVHRNLGDGVFSKPDTYPASTGDRVHGGDCNGDGLVDVAAAGADDAALVFLGHGDRTLDAARLVEAPLA
ncbi:MAG: VCBS repeat-containing protein, partial [Myxococcales bacterium]|nr:VCBS repeat-containing protein [Myxococcales bacterium]